MHLQNSRLERLNAAQSSRYRSADSLRDRCDVQTRVCLSLACSRQRKMRTAVHSPSGLLIDIVVHLQARTSPATRMGRSPASNREIEAILHPPATRPSRASSTELPSGLAIPSPVTTALRPSGINSG